MITKPLERYLEDDDPDSRTQCDNIVDRNLAVVALDCSSPDEVPPVHSDGTRANKKAVYQECALEPDRLLVSLR